ncbi:MAG TPA: hypothetical protein VD694_02315 [Nitrososphaeraceae archaeon]|nr:hypothetical protein [Nitrososphaeraceae archaeon]
MNSNKQDFDWSETITKPVYSVDDKCVGHVDGLENEQFIVKDRIINTIYYRLDRDLLKEYQGGKVKLKITEQELNSKYKRDHPGYFGE